MKTHSNTNSDSDLDPYTNVDSNIAANAAPDPSRLKLWEAAAAIALITFACLSVAVTFVALTVRLVVVETLGCFRRKGCKP
ncbi:MAG: hypothetical protein WCO57_02090 [Verrucomicrobiota bacterium]